MDWNIGLSARWIAYDEVVGGKMQGWQAEHPSTPADFQLGMI